MIILCYLLKHELNQDKEKNDFLSNYFPYMDNPSYLFLRCIFIENFNMKNEYKIRFIKYKSPKYYFNIKIFKSLKFHPFEIYDIELFLVKFKSILYYIKHLMNLEQNENLKNVVKFFFAFINEFSEIITYRYTPNIFIQEDAVKKGKNKFYSSEEFNDYFNIYIKYEDENKSLEQIKKLINLSFFYYVNPFYFRILDSNYLIKDENTSNNIKLEIIQYILDIILKYKKNTKEKDTLENIPLFLILMHKDICQTELKKKFPRELLNLFIKLFFFLYDINFLLNYKTFDLAYFDDEEGEIANKIKNKLLCEIILDIILKFFYRGNYNEQIIKSLIYKTSSNSSIFYERDIKKRFKESSDGNINDISFCLYFLIYFFERYGICPEEKKAFIKSILEIITIDLKNLYIKYKEINEGKSKNLKLKKIKIKGMNLDIYNELIDFCNKNHKDEKFTSKFLEEKYIKIKEQSKKTKENEDISNNILNKEKEDEKQKNKDNIENLNLKKQDLITKKLNLNNEIENIINKSNKKFKEKYINNNGKNEIKIEKNISLINYLKIELSKIDKISLYYELVVGKDYPKEILLTLFNPKEYYIWNKFILFLKDFLFYNKKFIKIRKTFKVHINKREQIRENNYKDNENFYLNYPTKIRNYTADEYYRPFLKPCMNFFNSKYLKISHGYIKENLMKNMIYKEETLNLIKFKRIMPELNKEKYFCELFKNKGNVFGYIELNDKFLIFKNSPNDILSSKNPEKSFPFLLSIEEDRIIDTNKFVLLFYEDIKEIIKRRVCLLYIGLEIFMKDNKTYMFNFFNKDNVNKFIGKIKAFTKHKNKILKKVTIKQDESENKEDKNIQPNSNKEIPNINVIIPNQNKSEINFKLIEDPISEFRKMQIKPKNKKGGLSNFEYLLLINKYSSRTYNDYNQYLIFPSLFLDAENKNKRDLSKPMCLNKENSENSYKKARINYSLSNFHFNQHYSTGGFVLYYLVRLIPFTYQHIIFQSNKFDSPTRLFSSINNIYLFLKVSEDNRELIPEFFFNFDFLVNLNYNDFGILEVNEENYHLNNVDTFCKYSFPEYIIKSRNYLEQSDLSPWIDNIFGAKQTLASDENPNLFPLKSYEEFSELKNIIEGDLPLKEKVNKIKEDVEFFKFGVTPAKLFDKLVDKITIKENEEEINNHEKKETKIINIINKYIQKKVKEKTDFYSINNNNSEDIELIFKFKNKIDILNINYGDIKKVEISLKIPEQIYLEPFNNSFCEVFPDIYCTVRHIDNTISFVNKTKIISRYYFNCLVTSIENKYNKNSEDKTMKEIFLGDENGFLHLLKIKFDFNHNEKIYEIKEIKITKSEKIHDKSIKGLLHSERLNIIFSWNDEDNYICLNNDYDLKFINIIKIDKDKCIKDILLSKYDLLYITCYNKHKNSYSLNCYTLNGIKVSSYEADSRNLKIIKCFADEKINIVFWNNNIFNFELYNLDNICNFSFYDFNRNDVSTEVKINSCQYYPKIKKYLMISSDNKASFFINDNINV